MHASPGRHVLLALTLALLLFLALTTLSRAPALADTATIYYATPNGTGNTCSRAAPCKPNAAVNKAASGDSVFLSAGTFTGSGGAVITITKSLALLCGWNGSATGGVIRNADTWRSVIDGENERRGIFVLASGPVGIDGCTIIRGTATMEPNVGMGGGILSGSAVPLFTNNVITGCVAQSAPDGRGVGGGVFVVNAPAGGTISRNRVIENRASLGGQGDGGGIALGRVLGLSVQQNTILRNVGATSEDPGYGGGLFIDECSSVTVTANEILANAAQVGQSETAGSNGGGVGILFSSWITLTDNLLRGNIASSTADASGGAVSMYGCNGIWLLDNLIDDNSASTGGASRVGRGGGVSATSTRALYLERNTVVRNEANESGPGYGGAFCLARSTSFTLTNNLIADNTAGLEGAALLLDGGGNYPVTGTLLHNTFARNYAYGAGQNAIHTGHRVTLRGVNNLFTNHGCAVYATAGAAITLTRTLFFGNTLSDTCGVGIVNLNPITGLDPLLKSNLRLGIGSPAIDAGVNAGVTVDLDGDPRPFGPAPDIGADESTVTTIKVYLPVVGRPGG